jgi:hypothetical protein
MSDFVIKSGSTAPFLVATLYDGDNPLNLTGATVRMRMRERSGGPLVVDSPAVIVGSPLDGVVSYEWQASDTDDVGEFEVEWQVTYLNGEVQTFPTEGYTTVTVTPSLTAEVDVLPALPNLCWPIDHGCCDDFDNYSEEVRLRADALAAQTMRMLTGYSVGGCPVTLRPCSISCASGARGWDWSGGTFNPHINGLGQWVNGCGCSGGCGCTALSTVHLGNYGTVTEVKVDGVVIAPTAYRVQNGTELVRLDGGTWPVCQDMALADTEVGTFSVRVQLGAPVDGLGAYAAGVLACEYAKACTGDKKCRLPNNVTSVTRQGVTMDLSSTAFPDGLTGIREVDLVIQRYNPHGLKMPSVVWSPDTRSAVVPQ